MKWKDACKILPEDGQYVAAMRYHSKQCWPLSAEIMFGKVESYFNSDGIRIVRVDTEDFTGAGNYCWDFPINSESDSDTIVAWCNSSEFIKPDFLRHK